MNATVVRKTLRTGRSPETINAHDEERIIHAARRAVNAARKGKR